MGLERAPARLNEPGGSFSSTHRQRSRTRSRATCRGGSPLVRNIWIICRKELGSYFVSPVAYILLAMFGLIFGFFFWNALGEFIIEGMQMQMRGQSFPMNVNEWIIRPLLHNVTVIGL